MQVTVHPIEHNIDHSLVRALRVIMYWFSLLHGTPATSAESQKSEAWPANFYGHLRESGDFGVSDLV